MEKCVLIIDDDETDRFFLERALGKAGVNCVKSVGTREEAEQFLNEASGMKGDEMPALIISDFQFYGESVELIRELRKTSVLRQTPIVVFSGTDAPENPGRAVESGATAFYKKPQKSEEYIALVQTIVERYLVS